MPCPGSVGMTMIEHTVAVLASRCSPVFVIAGPEQPLPAVGAEVLRDEVAGLGPLSAVTSSGSSAMPQIGQGPGWSWRTSGCIGQDHMVPSDTATSGCGSR